MTTQGHKGSFQDVANILYLVWGRFHARMRSSECAEWYLKWWVLLIILQFEDWQNFPAYWRKLGNKTDKGWKTAWPGSFTLLRPPLQLPALLQRRLPSWAGGCRMQDAGNEKRNKKPKNQTTSWTLACAEGDLLHTEKTLFYLRTVIKVKGMIYPI